MAATYADALRWMLNLGYTQADLDTFIRDNGAQDIRRIESAFNTYNDRALPTGGVAAATAAALRNVSTVTIDSLDHTGMVNPVAVPTPLDSTVGALTQTGDRDAIISGTGTGPRLAYSSTSAGSASSPAVALASPVGGVPLWVWIAAAVAVFYLMKEHHGR